MQVSYDGLIFELVLQVANIQEPVLSEDRTEFLHMRITYECRGIYNPKAMSYVASAPGGADAAPVDGARPAQTDQAIRSRLMRPGRQLIVTSGDGLDLIYRAPAPGMDVDPDNGPHPVSCSVSKATDKTWYINWRVTFAVLDCGDITGGTPPILSNRWTQSQETNLDRLTRITTRGLTVFRSDVLDRFNTNADFYRSYCIPGVPLNFQRQAISVNVNTAGNVLMWSVTDQEMHTSIGATADDRRLDVNWFEASFSMTSCPSDQGGKPTQNVMCQFDAYAKGARDASRQKMLDWLMKLAIERASLPNGPIDPLKQPMILRVSSSEKLHEPAVEIHVMMSLPPTQVARQGFGPMRTDFLGIDIINLFSIDGKNPQMPNDNNTRGSANTQMFAAAIKTACAPAPKPPRAAGPAAGSPDDNYLESSDAEVTVQVVSGLDEATTGYSEDATNNGSYTEMSVEARYLTDKGYMQVPVAGPVRPTSPGDGGGSLHGGDPPPGYPGGPEDQSGGPGGGGTAAPGPADGGNTGDTPGCVILALARPMTRVEFTFEAERCSVPPMIPSPDVSDANLVLLEEVVSPMGVGLAPDGFTPVYRVGGRYCYALKKARTPGDQLSFPVHPWTSFIYGTSPRTLPAEDFQHGIIDDGDSSGGDGGGTSGGDG